jgi:hypothetical protein
MCHVQLLWFEDHVVDDYMLSPALVSLLVVDRLECYILLLSS